MQASWLCTSPNSICIFEAGFPCRTMISWNSGTRHVQLHNANQLGCPLPVQQATARIHLQAAETSREKELSDVSSSKRRGAGLALRRTDATLTSLESAFTSLTSIGSHHTFSGSVILFMGTSLSKPREAIEIVFPIHIHSNAEPQASSQDNCRNNSLASACIQASRQLMPLTSQLPAPASGKTKMFVAVSNHITSPDCEPAKHFDTVAVQRCSLKRCLTSIVHVTVGTGVQPTQQPSWLMQHAEHLTGPKDLPPRQPQLGNDQEGSSVSGALDVCTTIVSGLTCSSGLPP